MHLIRRVDSVATRGCAKADVLIATPHHIALMDANVVDSLKNESLFGVRGLFAAFEKQSMAKERSLLHLVQCFVCDADPTVAVRARLPASRNVARLQERQYW